MEKVSTIKAFDEALNKFIELATAEIAVWNASKWSKQAEVVADEINSLAYEASLKMFKAATATADVRLIHTAVKALKDFNYEWFEENANEIWGYDKQDKELFAPTNENHVAT